jgi:hypothetical protein
MTSPTPDDPGFTYRASKQGGVSVHRRGRLVATLRGGKAQEFLAEIEGGDPAARQRLMARVTGNYKRGNERTAGSHPRNRR